MRSWLACVFLLGCGQAQPAPRWIEVDAGNLQATLRSQPEPLLLVNVWSTWCEPCVAELPSVIRFARGYQARGVGLVLISADPQSQRGAALEFLRQHDAPMPSWIKRGSDDAFVSAMHPDWSGALPATFLLDAQRRVLHFWPEPVNDAALRGPIEEALSRR